MTFLDYEVGLIHHYFAFYINRFFKTDFFS